MTCVVGMAREGRVYIGADSAGLSGWHLTVRADAKVFEAHGFLYGFSVSFRLGQILRYSFTPPDYAGGDLMAYMVSKYIPAVRSVVSAEISSKAQQEAPGDFLVGFRGRLFEVCSDFQVGEPVNGAASVGCGREPALGALAAVRRLSPELGPALALRLALETAEGLSGGVRGPFTVLELT
jgi:hypothetical protein